MTDQIPTTEQLVRGSGDRVLTTGQVSKVMGVSMRTVVSWIKDKKLKGFTIPGSQHRRVEEKHLRELMKDLGVSEERLELV